jgi:hypothetical protein
MRHVTASGVIDLFTGTAGSQLFDSVADMDVDVASIVPANALFTLSITDGRSAGATVLLER